jgi:hypothetical protein
VTSVMARCSRPLSRPASQLRRCHRVVTCP